MISLLRKAEAEDLSLVFEITEIRKQDRPPGLVCLPGLRDTSKLDPSHFPALFGVENCKAVQEREGNAEEVADEKRS